MLCITSNLIKHLSFVYTLLNDQTVHFKTIQFSISRLFTLSLNIKQFCLTHWSDRIRNYHSSSEWTWERWQWKGTPHSTKLQHYYQIVECYIQDTCRGGGLTPLQRCSRCILQPPLQLTGLWSFEECADSPFIAFNPRSSLTKSVT